MTHITMQSSAGAYSVTELTPYGEAVRDVTAATNELTEAQQIQGQILQRIQQENGDAFATRHGEITAEEMEIRTLNQEYQQLFQEIRDQNRDNPQAALDRIADLQREQVQHWKMLVLLKIQLVQRMQLLHCLPTPKQQRQSKF